MTSRVVTELNHFAGSKWKIPRWRSCSCLCPVCNWQSCPPSPQSGTRTCAPGSLNCWIWPAVRFPENQQPGRPHTATFGVSANFILTVYNIRSWVPHSCALPGCLPTFPPQTKISAPPLSLCSGKRALSCLCPNAPAHPIRATSGQRH